MSEPFDLENFYAPCQPITLTPDTVGSFGGFAYYLSRLSATTEKDGQAIIFASQEDSVDEYNDLPVITDLEYIRLNSASNKERALTQIKNKMVQKYMLGYYLGSQLVYFIDHTQDLALMDGFLENSDFGSLFSMTERALNENDFLQFRNALGIFVHSGQIGKTGDKQAIHFHIVYAVPPESSETMQIHTMRHESMTYAQLFWNKYGK